MKTKNYGRIIHSLGTTLLQYKTQQVPDRVMTVAICGLSCSGKSSLASDLEKRLSEEGSHVVVVEGDSFLRRKEKRMEVYTSILKTLESGGTLPPHFYTQIWDFEKMKAQLLEPLHTYDGTSSKRIQLRDLSKNKADGTTYTREFDVDYNSIVLVPSMYLRHVEGFHTHIRIEADIEHLIQRKIARDKRQVAPRDPSLTRAMVAQIEAPTMAAHIREYPVPEEIVIRVHSK